MFAFSDNNENEKSSEGKTFRGRLKIFLENITVHCYRNLVEEDRSPWERFLWFLVHVFAGACSITIILESWNGFNEAPLMTKLHNTLYPSSLIYFPGVSICNVNRISRRAAYRFAEELSRKSKDTSKSTDYYMKEILNLAALYTFEFDDENDMISFQRDLDDVYENQTFNIMNEIMIRLTPRCEDMMLRCFWQSKEYKCIDGKKFFERRRTQYGHCCVFNYVIRPNNMLDVPRNSTYTGPDMGLILLVLGQPNDYYYQQHSRVGFNVLIHNPYDYPDAPSGGVVQIPAMLGRETFIRVDANRIDADPFIVNYSPETRKCLFDADYHKMSTKFGGTYSRSQCMVYCRMKSVMALCDCVLFNMPIDIFFNDNGTSLQICNLNHVACLNKYKIKWLTVSTEILNVKGLEREREESLLCSECLPSCLDTKYVASSNSLPLSEINRKGSNIMETVKNKSQYALIRVFFGQPENWQYLQTVQLSWFEIISNFGGIFGILLGFSMLSATEIVYFIVREIFFWLQNKWQERKLDTEEGLVIQP
uniref:CSON015353 protein n=1 Tax=Culicoides sonorensis TaxID=179676 RepID=A0A336KSU2_CULSO